MKRSARLAVIDEALLDDIRIATPCTADWNEMHGDDRVRHCGECRLNVYDVSQMTRKEAATLIALHEGQRVCLRLYRRPDGTLLTQDCWQRLAAARRRGWVAFAAALVLVAATQLGLRFAALGWLLRLSGERTPPTVTAPLPAPTPPSVAPPAPLVEPTPEVQPEHEPKLMGKIALPPPPPKPSKPGKRSPKAPPPPEEFVIGDYSQLWRFPTGGKWAIPDPGGKWRDSRPGVNEHATQRLGRR